MKSIFTTKIGMTQVIDEDGVVTPVTVLKADENVVVQVKSKDNDGYDAIQIGYKDKKEKNVKKPIKGHFDKAEVSYKRFLREIRLSEETELKAGDTLGVDQFEEGEIVDVTATSKGKGTQGAIKRWNYGRGPESHGSKSHRVAGSRAIGAYGTARVFKGRKGSGKMGNERVTVQNLKVVKVSTDDSYILIKGAVPGPKGGLVEVKQAAKSL